MVEIDYIRNKTTNLIERKYKISILFRLNEIKLIFCSIHATITGNNRGNVYFEGNGI